MILRFRARAPASEEPRFPLQLLLTSRLLSANLHSLFLLVSLVTAKLCKVYNTIIYLVVSTLIIYDRDYEWKDRVGTDNL